MSFLQKPTLSYNPLFPHPVHPKVQEFGNIHFIGGRCNWYPCIPSAQYGLFSLSIQSVILHLMESGSNFYDCPFAMHTDKKKDTERRFYRNGCTEFKSFKNVEMGLLLNLGLGLAAHDGDLDNSDDKKELGSRILFRIPIEIGLLFTRHQGVSIMFDHVSNAYLADPNEGLDTIGFRYIYRF